MQVRIRRGRAGRRLLRCGGRRIASGRAVGSGRGLLLMIRSHNSIPHFLLSKLARLFARLLFRNFLFAEPHAGHHVRIGVGNFLG